MKRYKVVKVGYEQFNLVNIKDEKDWHWVAEDQEFKEGDVVGEEDFKLIECMFVDDESYGKAPFAFNVKQLAD